MFLVGILSWWYSRGWLNRTLIIKKRLIASADYFSIGLLIMTLFAPFRQISAGSVSGPINEQMHAFIDRLVSRFIGFIVRFFMIIFGLITMFIQMVFGILVLVFWLILPILPVVGLILMVIGWVPR